jgi:hypothetical protein
MTVSIGKEAYLFKDRTRRSYSFSVVLDPERNS